MSVRRAPMAMLRENTRRSRRVIVGIGDELASQEMGKM
jgi:hypothetical protein